MTWGLAIAAVLAFALAFTTHSAGWMGVGLVVGMACGIAAALVFIDRHVRASSRPEHMTDSEVAALRSTVRRDAKTSERLPPPAP